MKKAILIVSLFFLLTATIYSGTIQLKAATSGSQEASDPIFPGVGIITSRNMVRRPYQHNQPWHFWPT